MSQKDAVDANKENVIVRRSERLRKIASTSESSSAGSKPKSAQDTSKVPSNKTKTKLSSNKKSEQIIEETSLSPKTNSVVNNAKSIEEKKRHIKTNDCISEKDLNACQSDLNNLSISDNENSTCNEKKVTSELEDSKYSGDKKILEETEMKINSKEPVNKETSSELKDKAIDANPVMSPLIMQSAEDEVEKAKTDEETNPTKLSKENDSIDQNRKNDLCNDNNFSETSSVPPRKTTEQQVASSTEHSLDGSNEIRYENKRTEKIKEISNNMVDLKENGDVTIAKNESTPENLVNDVIDSKIDELLCQVQDDSSSDNESEPYSFIETMAEEGEEDTPSENSNDIIEVGEEINTTESDFSSDDSYEKDSFIDDEENYQLLSGEEYDLSLENQKKKSRIIKLSSGSDDSIVHIERKKKIPQKRKKSRIIRLVDSSDEEFVETSVQKQVQINENVNSKSNNPVEIETHEQPENKVSNHNLENVTANDTNETSEYSVEISLSPPLLSNSIENEPSKDTVVTNQKETENENDSGNTNSINGRLSPPVTSNVKNGNPKIIILENTKLRSSYAEQNGNNNLTRPFIPEAENLNDRFEDSLNGLKPLHNSTGILLENLGDSDQNVIKRAEVHQNEIINPGPSSENKLKTKKKKHKKRKSKQNGPVLLKFEVEAKSQEVNNFTITKNNKKRKGDTEPVVESKRKRMENEPKRKSMFVLSTNILDEAIMSNRNNCINLLQPSVGYEDWTVSNVILKPTRISEKSSSRKINKIKPTLSRDKTKNNIKKIHVKDFKNSMLYDSQRVKRMETQQLVKKKTR